jgi:uroporphyrinogen-III synthase
MGASTRDDDGPLTGLRILVTRARHQAEPLCRRIEAAGGQALRLPVLEIEAPSETNWLGLVDRLAEFQLAIFVSANAVQLAVPRLRARGVDLARLRLAAVGQKTAAALKALGCEVDICPCEAFTSEALLALPAMHSVRGQGVIIFRGEGGRELLAEALRARGALVEYAEVYRRALPRIQPRRVTQLVEQAHLITCVSAQALRNLDAMVGDEQRARLRGISLLTGSARMLELAQTLGFADAMTARDPSDEAMFAAILQWAEGIPRD